MRDRIYENLSLQNTTLPAITWKEDYFRNPYMKKLKCDKICLE